MLTFSPWCISLIITYTRISVRRRLKNTRITFFCHSHFSVIRYKKLMNYVREPSMLAVFPVAIQWSSSAVRSYTVQYDYMRFYIYPTDVWLSIRNLNTAGVSSWYPSFRLCANIHKISNVTFTAALFLIEFCSYIIPVVSNNYWIGQRIRKEQ